MTFFGIVSVVAMVGLVLAFLVSLGFLAGTVLRKPLLAAVVLLFLWYPVGIVLNDFSLEEFSPISLSRAMSTQLRRPWRAADAKLTTDAAPNTDALAEELNHFLHVFSAPPREPKPIAGPGGSPRLRRIPDCGLGPRCEACRPQSGIA
ncbi:MAG: hypothetical protein MUC88_23515 [Planctomycetes bacterium]|nr:hypothetical protein [Planctomycetota bacterium]